MFDSKYSFISSAVMEKAHIRIIFDCRKQLHISLQKFTKVIKIHGKKYSNIKFLVFHYFIFY